MKDQTKTPLEIWNQIKEIVATHEKDIHKATRGMRAGGVRIRNAGKELEQLAKDIRKAVLVYRKERKPGSRPRSSNNIIKNKKQKHGTERN